MPVFKIPTVKQAESKLRLCKSILNAYEMECYELIELHRSGELTQQQLAVCLLDLNSDIRRLKNEIESTRIIHRQISAA